jgi:hypothetical protein
MEFVRDHNYPCVECGVWVPVEDCVDRSCLRCLDTLLVEEEEDFYY